MIEKRLICLDGVPENLLSSLESRDVALWVRNLTQDPASQEALVDFLGLPWRLVFSEVYDPDLVKALETAATFSDPLTRKRGFIQIIDSDPSRIELPQRCLPIYLLNGREATPDCTDFASRLRRMTMLEELRRSGIREILVISGEGDPVPPDLKDLWSSGFRSYLTVVSSVANADQILEDWIQKTEGFAAANLLRLSTRQLVKDILARYSATYPESRHVIRVRDHRGGFHLIDVTDADEPERPILERYQLIEERDLVRLMPDELSEEDFVGFFRNPEESWRPYAAGLPWIRDPKSKKELSNCLRKLDAVGSEEDCIAYISCESGAGGTTLARWLAWECAQEGYPVLVAKSLSFVPDALSVTNFLTRVHRMAESHIAAEIESAVGPDRPTFAAPRREPVNRLYETPWVLVFDSLHWQSRDSELVRFRSEMEKSGRPVCVLVVTGTVRGLSFFNTSIFRHIAELNHCLVQDEAHRLGRHLNKFLRVYGKERQDWQWNQFFKDHTVRYLEGVTAFWVTLSFWIQGQYDLSESIQHWMFRKFKENADDRIVKEAILEIAALSSERLPLPEVLLPSSKGEWPVSHLLEDNRSSLSALGLVRLSENGERHWALVHDILGRFLINALFYDFTMREELGFANAKDAEHLRFLLLRQISQKPALGERAYRALGESFATSIFKIDPDHGRGSLAPLWREVLEALDSMPRSLRDTSRVVRHHSAISRRRIAKLDETFYGVTQEDKFALLNDAIEDITYALTFIDYTPGSESNLNLFNSLANAYLDLAEAESVAEAPRARIIELRRLADDATRKAYAENPTSSFVVETYVKNLLEDSSERAIERCVEALGILFAALISNEKAYRRSQLGSLADRALGILFKQSPETIKDKEPSSAIDVLVRAWRMLAEGGDYRSGMTLVDVPEGNRERALGALAHPAGQGNMQVMRLAYDLTSLVHPHAFKQQLDLVEQLHATAYRMSPQIQLEYAILLFFNERTVEGEKMFRRLRQIWRESEHFVQVPDRLRWLRAADGETLKTVKAISGSDFGSRAMARVQEFGSTLVHFRPEEFGFRDLKPGRQFSCHVSFGHNGPFLRPVTAHGNRAS